MKIRDSHALLSNDKTEYTMPSGGLDIIADDGRTLFGISLNKDGAIRVDGGSVCRQGGVILDDRIMVSPHASNVVVISRPKV